MSLQIVLPVHNEADSIESVVAEICDVLADWGPLELILAEDGSTDGTPDVLERMKGRFPIRVLSTPGRKGYARAVVDGLGATDAERVLFLDSDGQYDPRDFGALHEALRDCDLAVGWRRPRRDATVRLLMSGAFGLVHRMLFRVPLHDPSCSFVLMRQHALRALLPGLGQMSEGFWWEFSARAHRSGLRVREVPVRHRSRAQGGSRVFSPAKVPGIALRNLREMIRLEQQTRPAPRQD